jgi:hypothetical protein
MAKEEFPYVFGGDGTTLLIPPYKFDGVARALDGVRHLAEDSFNMRLRVGAIRIGDLEASEGVVEVARFSECDALTISESNLLLSGALPCSAVAEFRLPKLGSKPIQKRMRSLMTLKKSR